MADTYTPPVYGTGAKATIQRIGGHLAGMIMPNIGAFIAWGLITALFIPTGWVPNADLAAMVDPIIKVLLPVLIAYTGGRMVHGQRGAVVGAVAAMGVVVGADAPMFLGAMIIGPLTAWILKKVDAFTEARTRAGFEMLVDNFSAGIIGGAMAVAGVLGIGPIVQVITGAAEDAVGWLIATGLLPFASVLIELAQGPVPQQRRQPRRPRPARRDPGGGDRQVDPVHAGVEPRPRPRPAPRLHVLRPAGHAAQHAARDDHPLLRRHPRDLLPVRADEAPPHPGRHRRRHGRRVHLHGHRRRSGRHAVAGQHLRLPGRHAARRPVRVHRGHRGRHGRVVRPGRAAAGLRPRREGGARRRPAEPRALPNPPAPTGSAPTTPCRTSWRTPPASSPPTASAATPASPRRPRPVPPARRREACPASTARTFTRSSLPATRGWAAA
ncbi:PTS transporter subunit EIIC [Nonomuraea ferruginea]